jgi:hypothetical protein
VLQIVQEPRIAPQQDEAARVAAQNGPTSAAGGLPSPVFPPGGAYPVPRAPGAA